MDREIESGMREDQGPEPGSVGNRQPARGTRTQPSRICDSTL